jgi:putative addiction module component (TIGR02574 family)
MKQIDVSDALTLSISKRIQLVEEIWDSIAADVQAIKLTEEEKKIIDKRLESFNKNPNLDSSWKDVYKRVLRK